MGFFHRGKPTEPVDAHDGTNEVAMRLPGGRVVNVSGESHYQEALGTICGGKSKEGHNKDCQAELVPEPSNPYDPGAISVYIEGHHVGYLTRDAARAFAPVAGRLAQRGYTAVCRATVVGGWKRGRGSEGHFGVRLDLADPADCLRFLDQR